ncbi:uncharacterized protein B0H64DRAFT_431669 [Chaetomium fimeti]|uniref:F-box domain-containing protein n=1 Tax=Chaetomium fimeti TaxID=1854472 RepID=A0AAE0LUY4_9PEZI|nr:hypothetical protein B0H64DRAFT_431669 [Chaetomium fimeti]
MAGRPFEHAGAEDVVGVPELGAIILGFLEDVQDLRNAALTSKRFNRAAQFHLWAAIKLPYLQADPSWIDQRPFWDEFSSHLERNTFSLHVDLPVAAPGLAEIISQKPWETRVSSNQPEWFVTKDKVDDFFTGLKETLTRAPRLRRFTARDVPRILDLAVLLQRHRPELVSLSITASKRDTFGFLCIPNFSIDHWRWKMQQHPRSTVSLGNTVNFGLDTHTPIVPPVFNFPNLRVLALNNIQHDGRRPSVFLENVVSILKGSQNLSHLELSLRHEIGGMSPDGSFVRRLYGTVEYPDGPNNAMEVLPLHLKTLTLGYGFEIRDEASFIFPQQGPHHLAWLTDLQTLEGLHLQGILDKDGSYIRQLSGRHGFSLITTPPHILRPTRLPRLRKITWPWDQGDLLRLLWRSNSDRLQQIVVRIDVSSPSEWRARHGDACTCPLWVGTESLEYITAEDIYVKGFVFPTESMRPQDADAFLAWVHGINRLQALKIRMPPLTAPRHVKGKNHMRTFWGRVKQMTHLRELWLADGLGTWSKPEGEPGRYVAGRYPKESEFRHYSTTAANKCPDLVYIRILDRAWHITRSGYSRWEQQITLHEVPKDRVEKDIPDSFDFSTPEYI